MPKINITNEHHPYVCIEINNFALKFLSEFSVDAPKLILFECPLYYYRYKEQESLKPEFSKAEQLKEALGNAQAVKKKLKESTKQLQNVENTHARYKLAKFSRLLYVFFLLSSFQLPGTK